MEEVTRKVFFFYWNFRFRFLGVYRSSPSVAVRLNVFTRRYTFFQRSTFPHLLPILYLKSNNFKDEVEISWHFVLFDFYVRQFRNVGRGAVLKIWLDMTNLKFDLTLWFNKISRQLYTTEQKNQFEMIQFYFHPFITCSRNRFQ